MMKRFLVGLMCKEILKIFFLLVFLFVLNFHKELLKNSFSTLFSLKILVLLQHDLFYSNEMEDKKQKGFKT